MYGVTREDMLKSRTRQKQAPAPVEQPKPVENPKKSDSLGYDHLIVNSSKNPINVTLELHGYLGVAGHCASCCNREATIPVGGYKTLNTKLCQLKRITVKEKVDGKNVVTKLNIQNASKTIAAGAIQIMVAAAAMSDGSASGALAGGYIASQDPFEFNELVAYGSTDWNYQGPNRLTPTKGVDIYGMRD